MYTEIDEILSQPVTDESASIISEFLMQLALWYEGKHCAQICRHHQSQIPVYPEHDPRQLTLFPSTDDPF